MLMEFGKMKVGTHFQERSGRRKFIKLQTVLPGGLTQTNGTKIDSDGAFAPYNAMDYDGIGGLCPDWLEFEVINKP